MKLSVICPVYNTPAPLLAQAARSVLDEREGLVAELILVDDASTDNATIMEIARIATLDPRVRVLRQAQNAGHSSARNAGVAAATGDWIGGVDSDDLWMPGWAARAHVVLQQHPEARWISGNYNNLFPDRTMRPSASLASVCPGTRLGERLMLMRSPDLTRHLIGNAWLVAVGSLIRKDLYVEAGGFADGLHYHPDILLLMKLSVLADLYFVDDEVYAYRKGHESMMSSPARLSTQYLRMYDLAGADAVLRPFKREIRWSCYAAYKGLALNNLLAGRRLAAARLALQAWLIDPREVRDLRVFWGLLTRARKGNDIRGDRSYSSAEQISSRTDLKGGMS